VQIGKGEHRHGSVFGPSGGLLPGAILFQALRSSLIAASIALLKIQRMKALQVFLKSLANERGSVHLLPPRRDIGSL
jgi:hypothetical protein